MSHTDAESRGPTTRQSIAEYGRGIAGGLVFSLPLIYTMEVWWTGFIAEPVRLIVYLLAVFALLLGYNFYAGLHPAAGPAEIAIDSVEEMGLGLLVSAGVLFALERINAGMGLSEVAGKVVVEAMTVAIGVSVGTAQLGGGDEDGAGGSEWKSRAEGRLFGQLTLALCGAVLFAANVAPTEEVLMLAAEAPAWKLALLVLLSLLLELLVLVSVGFESFDEAAWGSGRRGYVLAMAGTYAIALIASAAMLWFFGRFDGCGFGVCLAQAVVLGLPAALGASAGRRLIQ